MGNDLKSDRSKLRTPGLRTSGSTVGALPKVKGAATLYTKEYFEMVKAHLKPGGVISQWVPMYESHSAAVESQIATFMDVFPNGTVWGNTQNGRGYDLVLLGTNGPTMINIDSMNARMGNPQHAQAIASLREVGFGTHLRGTGSQWGWELRVGLALQRRGWRLVYDPALGVDHHIEPRQVDDQYHRGLFNADELRIAASNETMILLEFLPAWRATAFLWWAVLVGTRMLPGVLQMPRLLFMGQGWRWRDFAAAMRGRLDGVRARRGGA